MRKSNRASTPPSFDRERELQSLGFARIAGVDEAGRGPLAGPVVAAAVILPSGFQSTHCAQLNDSKQLNAALRESLFEELTSDVEFGIGVVEAAVIDAINIRQASWRAMQLAVAELERRAAPIEYALVDGLPYGPGPWQYEAIVKGDARCLSIAAASVLAKVTRDKLMQEHDLIFPQYGFARHKGYSSPQHLRTLAEHGPCSLHRMSYAPVRRLVQGIACS
ncbi:MAG TPA: ribonuclease HII [Abditibacteriaceae bacterium]|nr:ribonuclease HII [Abditibacteriaceae bacterium]